MSVAHHLVEEVGEKLKEWQRQRPGTKLVVGIDGYPGVGKTTLLSELSARNPNILPLERDDFCVERKEFAKLYAAGTDRLELFTSGLLYQDRLKAFIEGYRTTSAPRKELVYNRATGKVDVEKIFDFSKPLLVVEGVFLLHPKLSDELFDRRIWLKGDRAAIDARRIAREQARWGEEYHPEDRPDSYFAHTLRAFARYEERYIPESRADLVLDVDQA